MASKIKYTILFTSIISYIIFTFVSMLIFNNVWKIKTNIIISNPMNQEYTFLYKRFGHETGQHEQCDYIYEPYYDKDHYGYDLNVTKR